MKTLKRRLYSVEISIIVALVMTVSGLATSLHALTFEKTATYLMGNGPYQVSITDFNGDQISDFATVNVGV